MAEEVPVPDFWNGWKVVMPSELPAADTKKLLGGEESIDTGIYRYAYESLPMDQQLDVLLRKVVTDFAAKTGCKVLQLECDSGLFARDDFRNALQGRMRWLLQETPPDRPVVVEAK